ncbi:MAG: PhoD-like phosphatase N-terminal domain-containing protein, partial [Pseudomonadales bacterium]
MLKYSIIIFAVLFFSSNQPAFGMSSFRHLFVEQAAETPQAELSIDNLQLVGKKRLDRTIFEYEYRADIENTGGPVRFVTVEVSSTSSTTIVNDASLDFGDVNENSTVISTDTFSIQLDRRVPFDRANLSFAISSTPLASFPNGVAAGDVEQTSVILWARAAFTGIVRFEYGIDPAFQGAGFIEREVEYFGEGDNFFDGVDADNSPPVKVELTELIPGTQYYYRACRDSCPADITEGTEVHGRFRTPHSDGNNGLRFGVTSCFDGNKRPFVAIKNVPGNVVSQDLDFFVALGDTTYADNPDDFTEGPAKNLKKFRKKNELVYKQLNSLSYYIDESLASEPLNDNFFSLARESTAFYSMIDDHEVINNFSGGVLAKRQLATPECNREILGDGDLGKCFCNDDLDNDGVVDNPL